NPGLFSPPTSAPRSGASLLAHATAVAAANMIPAAKIKVLIGIVGAVALPAQPSVTDASSTCGVSRGDASLRPAGTIAGLYSRDERDSVESRPRISKSGRTLGAPAYLSLIFLMLASLETHIRRRSELQRPTILTTA